MTNYRDWATESPAMSNFWFIIMIDKKIPLDQTDRPQN